MYNIWLCEVYSSKNKLNDDYGLSYDNLLYEEVSKDDINRYIDSICNEYGYTKGVYFGSSKQCLEVKSDNFGNKEYCIFLEELEGDEI